MPPVSDFYILTGEIVVIITPKYFLFPPVPHWISAKHGISILLFTVRVIKGIKYGFNKTSFDFIYCSYFIGI